MPVPVPVPIPESVAGCPHDGICSGAGRLVGRVIFRLATPRPTPAVPLTGVGRLTGRAGSAGVGVVDLATTPWALVWMSAVSQGDGRHRPQTSHPAARWEYFPSRAAAEAAAEARNLQKRDVAIIDVTRTAHRPDIEELLRQRTMLANPYPYAEHGVPRPRKPLEGRSVARPLNHPWT